ncbi:MAG: hypothetical protein HUU11_19220 [Anaerolineales bacterium]|nr:hypothetical protein [Anaerolineales bacterium]
MADKFPRLIPAPDSIPSIGLRLHPKQFRPMPELFICHIPFGTVHTGGVKAFAFSGERAKTTTSWLAARRCFIRTPPTNPAAPVSKYPNLLSAELRTILLPKST